MRNTVPIVLLIATLGKFGKFDEIPWIPLRTQVILGVGFSRLYAIAKIPKFGIPKGGKERMNTEPLVEISDDGVGMKITPGNSLFVMRSVVDEYLQRNPSFLSQPFRYVPVWEDYARDYLYCVRSDDYPLLWVLYWFGFRVRESLRLLDAYGYYFFAIWCDLDKYPNGTKRSLTQMIWRALNVKN